jgi:hypothetical protein
MAQLQRRVEHAWPPVAYRDRYGQCRVHRSRIEHQVQSIQPVITVSGPANSIPGQPDGVPGQQLTFTFNASQPGLPPDAVYTFNVLLL